MIKIENKNIFCINIHKWNEMKKKIITTKWLYTLLGVNISPSDLILKIYATTLWQMYSEFLSWGISSSMGVLSAGLGDGSVIYSVFI